MLSLDVTHINAIEGLLLSNVASAFSWLIVYAKHLLYYFTAFEIIMSGFAWALYQNQAAERLFGQLLKIGLVLFLVENFTSILNSILSSVLIIGQQLGQSGSENILLNPGLIWQNGYNFAISLLQAAANADGFALPMILIVMGFGILLVVGIFGIQIFIQVVAFYFVAAMSLLFIPLSVFSPLRDFFSQSMKSLLQASIRLMIQMILVSAAMSVWSTMQSQTYTPAMNINAPLGFLFSGLLFVCASACLPRLAEKVIGGIQWQTNPISSQSVRVTAPAASAQPASSLSSTQAAALMTTQGSWSNSAAMAVQAPASMSVYARGIRDDFFSKQSAGYNNSSLGFSHKQAFEQQQKEDVKKVKLAFYEVINELKNAADASKSD
jgi:hypothetical protein